MTPARGLRKTTQNPTFQCREPESQPRIPNISLQGIARIQDPGSRIPKISLQGTRIPVPESQLFHSNSLQGLRIQDPESQIFHCRDSESRIQNPTRNGFSQTPTSTLGFEFQIVFEVWYPLAPSGSNFNLFSNFGTH